LSGWFYRENLTVFSGHFLIVHLAPNSGMDGYLGFTLRKLWPSPIATFKPQIDVHPLWSV